MSGYPAASGIKSSPQPGGAPPQSGVAQPAQYYMQPGAYRVVSPLDTPANLLAGASLIPILSVTGCLCFLFLFVGIPVGMTLLMCCGCLCAGVANFVASRVRSKEAVRGAAAFMTCVVVSSILYMWLDYAIQGTEEYCREINAADPGTCTEDSVIRSLIYNCMIVLCCCGTVAGLGWNLDFKIRQLEAQGGAPGTAGMMVAAPQAGQPPPYNPNYQV